MPTRNVELAEHFDRLIADGIDSGRFNNASEVVHEGLRLLEQRQAEDAATVAWLRAAAQEGIDDLERGDYVTANTREEIAAIVRKAGSQRP